jgi:hypothetical protein
MQPKRIQSEKTPPLALLGKEALKKGGYCTETKTIAKLNQGLPNPALERRI